MINTHFFAKKLLQCTIFFVSKRQTQLKEYALCLQNAILNCTVIMLYVPILGVETVKCFADKEIFVEVQEMSVVGMFLLFNQHHPNK